MTHWKFPTWKWMQQDLKALLEFARAVAVAGRHSQGHRSSAPAIYAEIEYSEDKLS